MRNAGHRLTVVALATAVVVSAILMSVSHRLGAQVSAESSAKTSDPNVVGVVGDEVVTRSDLEKRMLQAIRPRDEEFCREPEPVTAEATLLEMLAEKAISMEGRERGYLQDEQLYSSITRFEHQQIIGRMLEAELGPKLKIEEAEVDRVMKANPKASRPQARAAVQRSKVVQLRSEFYKQICDKRGVKKMSENFAKAAEIHERLSTKPLEPRARGQYWIANGQIMTDLSEEERNLPLATYEGGTFTLKDWFRTLCEYPPPRRPKDLSTPQGVEKLLDGALMGPILAVEAKSRGYDQAPDLRSAIRVLEDQQLLSKMQTEKTKGIQEPTPEEVKEYFEKNPERFAKNALLKADQIWCQDEESARKAKAELEAGEAFGLVWKKYAVDYAEREKTGPKWLRYFAKPEESEILPPEPNQPVAECSVIPSGTTTRGGFEITVPEGEQMIVNYLRDERIVYWSGKGEIKKTSSKERAFFPPFEATVSCGSEGLFWPDLWKGEPNQVIGPARGFTGNGVKWRVAKIVEKTPAEVQPFSEQLANSAKWVILAEWKQLAIKDLEKEMLAKYPHEILHDRIKDLDPVELAMKQPVGPVAGM